MAAIPSRPTHDFHPLRFCGVPAISADERRERIASVAYFLAAGRGFDPGHDTEDWLAAETEVDQQLSR